MERLWIGHCVGILPSRLKFALLRLAGRVLTPMATERTHKEIRLDGMAKSQRRPQPPKSNSRLCESEER